MCMLYECGFDVEFGNLVCFVGFVKCESRFGRFGVVRETFRRANVIYFDFLVLCFV